MRTLESEIEELRKELDSMRNELQVKEAALAWLEKRLNSGHQSDSQVMPSKGGGMIDLTKVQVPETAKRRTLVDEVLAIIRMLGDQEFTVAHIQAVMAQRGIEFSAKNPRASLSVALGKLQDQGEIVVTKEGKGNVPHVYVAAKKDDLLFQKDEAAELAG